MDKRETMSFAFSSLNDCMLVTHYTYFSYHHLAPCPFN